MGIHKYVKPIIFGQSQDTNGVLNPLLVVYARSSRLNSLPCKYVSNGIVSPALQSGKMDMCILARKGAGMEIDIVSVKEVFWDMGRLVWIAGIFRISGDVYSSQSDLSAMGIEEMAVLDRESQRRHSVQIASRNVTVTQETALEDSESSKSREKTPCQLQALKAKRVLEGRIVSMTRMEVSAYGQSFNSNSALFKPATRGYSAINMDFQRK